VREYTVRLNPDERGRGFDVLVPTLPGCTTHGRTRREAILNAKEAIAAHIAGLEADGQRVPEEREPIEVLKVEV
jgi:predicted RNase H-like HicB family nuclease